VTRKMTISDPSPQDSTSSVFSNPQLGQDLIIRLRSSDLECLESTLRGSRATVPALVAQNNAPHTRFRYAIPRA
jgi:hypothetical protein